MTDELRVGADDAQAEIADLRPRRVWPKFLLMHLTILITGLALLRHYRKPPHRPRVLVAVDLEGTYFSGSEQAEVLAERFGERALALGLEIVYPRDRDATAILKKTDLAAGAKELDAAFVLVGKTKVEATPYPLPNAVAPFWDVRGELDLFVIMDGGAPQKVGSLTALVGAPDRGLALRGVAESLADQAIDAAVGPMLRSPAAGRFASLKTAKGEPALAHGFSWLSLRERAERDAAAAYARGVEARRAGEKGSRPITFLGAPSAHDELLGVGDQLLVATGDIRATLSFETRQPGFQRLLRGIELWPIHTGTRTSLYRGAGLYALPRESSPPLALVEDLFGYARSLTIVEAQGLRRVRVDGDKKWDAPRVAPGGGLVAVQERASQTASPELVVYAIANGKELYREKGDQFYGHAWLSAQRLVFVHRSKGESGPLVASGTAIFPVDFDVNAGVRGAPWLVPDGEVWSQPIVVGAKLAFERKAEGRGVGELDLSTGVFGKRGLGFDARALSPAGDGRIVFELHDPKAPEELALLPLEGPPIVLTKNLARDLGPRFSPDGKRVWFTSEADDPWFPGQRTVSFVAWLEP